MNIYSVLEKLRKSKPIVFHITNYVTISECAASSKAIGASPVMAFAKEEAADMASISDSLVLNIGTLDSRAVESMIIAANKANEKGIPVLLDACGSGATPYRDSQVKRILNECNVSILKGNQSEIAKIYGSDVKTRGVDSGDTEDDMVKVARALSQKLDLAVVITGKKDIVAFRDSCYLVENGNERMGSIVGTGCMASSIIGSFAAVTKDYGLACICGLVALEISGEHAFIKSKSPMEFKNNMIDGLESLDSSIDKEAKVVLC